MLCSTQSRLTVPYLWETCSVYSLICEAWHRDMKRLNDNIQWRHTPSRDSMTLGIVLMLVVPSSWQHCQYQRWHSEAWERICEWEDTARVAWAGDTRRQIQGSDGEGGRRSLVHSCALWSWKQTETTADVGSSSAAVFSIKDQFSQISKTLGQRQSFKSVALAFNFSTILRYFLKQMKQPYQAFPKDVI